MTHKHLTEKQLQQLLDLPEQKRHTAELFMHIQSCPVCRERFRSLELIHAALQKQPVEPPDEVQVDRIMLRVRSRQSAPVLIPVMQRFAYIVALSLVLGIVGIIFYQFNVIDFVEIRTPAAEASGFIWEYYNTMQERITSFAVNISEVYDRMFGAETFPVLMFTVLVLILAAIIDRWFLSSILYRS